MAEYVPYGNLRPTGWMIVKLLELREHVIKEHVKPKTSRANCKVCQSWSDDSIEKILNLPEELKKAKKSETA